MSINTGLTVLACPCAGVKLPATRGYHLIPCHSFFPSRAAIPDRSAFLSQVFFGIADTKSRGRQMESSLKRISLMIILYLSWLMIASSMK
jgi:hypothetical protein